MGSDARKFQHILVPLSLSDIVELCDARVGWVHAELSCQSVYDEIVDKQEVLRRCEYLWRALTQPGDMKQGQTMAKLPAAYFIDPIVAYGLPRLHRLLLGAVIHPTDSISHRPAISIYRYSCACLCRNAEGQHTILGVHAFHHRSACGDDATP
jgi:hypothetical protein